MQSLGERVPSQTWLGQRQALRSCLPFSKSSYMPSLLPIVGSSRGSPQGFSCRDDMLCFTDAALGGCAPFPILKLRARCFVKFPK